ncbi:replication initiation protein [Endozoicomonas sp.]|uniref:replication initiation protein n=1 Tax=Endozoicomonas sp. TaxID=1892382 RepID=UPI00383A766E
MSDIDHIKITKANKLTEVRLLEVGNRLKLSDQKVVLAVVGQLSPNDEDFKDYHVKVSELVSLTGIAKENLYREIEAICNRLISSVITIKEENNLEGFVKVTWFSHAEYIPSQGIIGFSFSPRLKPYLLQLKSHFTTYSLKQVVHLKSTYSIRLYELLRQFLPLKGVNNGRSVAFREITLVDLRDYLGVEKSRYAKFYEFKRNVLDRCQLELAEHTDLKFEYTQIRAGRKINSINFKISHNAQFEEIDDGETAIPVPDSLMDKVFTKNIRELVPDISDFEIGMLTGAYSTEILYEAMYALYQAKVEGRIKGTALDYYRGILKNTRREDQAANPAASKSTAEKLTDRSWADGLNLDGPDGPE